MNCHHHDFLMGGSSSGDSNHHHHSNNNNNSNHTNRAMSEIVITHDVNHALTTSYAAHEVGTETVAQRQQRQRNLALAKAEAVTSRYSHILGAAASTVKLPVQQQRQQSQQQQQQQQQRQRPRRMSAEPNYLALSNSFRKSNSSLASSDCGDALRLSGHASSHHHHQQQQQQDNDIASNAINDECVPTPPPLKTDVTILLLKQAAVVANLKNDDYHLNNNNNTTITNNQDAVFPPHWTENVTDKVTNPPTLKSPPPPPPTTTKEQQYYKQYRRVSDSSALCYTNSYEENGGTKSRYRERASFQALSSPHASNKIQASSLYPSTAALLADTTGTTTVAATTNNHHQSARSSSSLYQELLQHQQQLLRDTTTNGCSTATPDTTNTTCRVGTTVDVSDDISDKRSPLAYMTIQEQAQIMQCWDDMLQQQPHQHHSPNGSNNTKNNKHDDEPSAAIQEQEALWRELSQRHHPLTSSYNHSLDGAPAVAPTYAPVAPPTTTTTTPTSHTLSPREEQARLWEQIRQERLRQQQQQQHQPQYPDYLDSSRDVEYHGPSGTSSVSGEQLRRLSPLEEQALLLEEIQQKWKHNWNNNSSASFGTTTPTGLSTVEEQERMFMALALQRYGAGTTPDFAGQMQQLQQLQQQQQQRSSSSAVTSTGTTTTKHLSPIEVQAKRLQEIQDEKEQQIVEMACKMSMTATMTEDSSAPSLSLSSLSDQPVEEEDDLSLQYIMDLSRREAEAESTAEDRAFQIAMERSREDLGGSIVLLDNGMDNNGLSCNNRHEAPDSNGIGSIPEEEQQQQQSRADLELRRSIAELACQSSERTLDEGDPVPVRSTGMPTGIAFPLSSNTSSRQRRRTWGLSAFRYRYSIVPNGKVTSKGML